MDGTLPVLVSGLCKSVELLKDLKNAPAEILELTDDIEILSGVLVQFEEALESARPRITETNKQQNEYRTGKILVIKIQKTMDKLILYRNIVSIAAKDGSLPQKLLAWLRWLSVKSLVTTAGHAIQKLSSLASLFLNSIICKNLAAQIAELQRNQAEVPTMLYLKLKTIMQTCEREERRVESASDKLSYAGQATLEKIGLRPKDIRELRRMGDKITEEATTAVKKAQRYTIYDSGQQKRRKSSRLHQPAKYPSSRSAQSPSPPLRPARRTPQSTGTSAQHSPPATPQPRAHKNTQTPQRRRSRLGHTPGKRGGVMALLPHPDGSETTSSQSASEFEPPGRSKSRLSSANPVSSFPATGSHDIPQISSARVIPDPLPFVKKRKPGIYGSRVRDNGTNIIIEESEWPAELLSPSERGRTSSDGSVICLEADGSGSMSIATEPHDSEQSSSTVSQEVRDHRDHKATEKRTRNKRFGEEYKPSGLFTASDLEERRRRDRGGRNSNSSHAR